MNNSRYLAPGICAAILISIFVNLSAARCAAQDMDQNGLSDSLEQILADKFRPSFVVNRGNILEPEPVEILDVSGNGYLDVDDIHVMHYQLDGAMLCSDWFCSCIPNATVCIEPNRFYNQNMRGLTGGSEPYVSFYDYGGAGNETPWDWETTYLNGRGVTLPGSSYPPTVYCHFVAVTESNIVMQYWFYYPYNAGWNNHEGDWRHLRCSPFLSPKSEICSV